MFHKRNSAQLAPKGRHPQSASSLWDREWARTCGTFFVMVSGLVLQDADSTGRQGIQFFQFVDLECS